MIKKIALLAMFAPLAMADEIQVRGDQNIAISLSKNEISRLSMGKPLRIDKYWGGTESMEVTIDKEQGELYLRPKAIASDDFSFFIRDSNGTTYSIAAKVKDIPSQNIVLRSHAITGIKSASVEPLVKKIKSLLKAMVQLIEHPDYRLSPESTNSSKKVWSECEISLISVYSNQELQGDIYTLKNISTSNIIIEEKEFTSLTDGIRAISIEKLKLAPNEETKLYVVRSVGE